MVKRLFSLFVLCLLTLAAFAQEDVFRTIGEVRGKHVRIVSGDLSPFTYVMLNGKLKPVQKDKKHVYAINGRSYQVDSEAYLYKKDTYLVLKGGRDIFFLKESDSPVYLSFLRNESVWEEYLHTLNATYTYLDVETGRQYHDRKVSPIYDKLAKLRWTGFQYSGEYVSLLVSEQSDVGVVGRRWEVTPATFQSLKDVVYIHKDSISPYIQKYEERLAREKREKEVRDSIAKREREERDSLLNCKLRLAEVREDLTFGEGDEALDVAKGDTVAVYAYDDKAGKFAACYHFSTLLFDDDDLRFADATYDRTQGWVSADRNYLLSQKKTGAEQRYAVASKYEEERAKALLSLLGEQLRVIRERQTYMKTHQIFITSMGYNFNGDQFGMDFSIYNCFGKTIKYVVLTLTCYNQVGDVQRDYFGRASRTVRGIGPIEPAETGDYSWEDVFWDEYDVIDHCNVTAIRFIFRDGTSKSFSGSANIKRHIASDAWE